MDAPMGEGAPSSFVPQTGRERVRQALQVSEMVLRMIEAPKDLARWPRKDRDAWLEVVGRPRIALITQTWLNPPQEAPDA